MTAFVFISGIHRTNGSDNEQLFGKSHSLFAAPKAKPSPTPSQGKAGMRGVACGTPPGPGVTVCACMRFACVIRSGYLVLAQSAHVIGGSRFTRPASNSRRTLLIVGHSSTKTNFRSHFESLTVYKSTNFDYLRTSFKTNVKLVVRKRNV